MILPVILCLLLAWITGILCADGIVATTRYLTAHPAPLSSLWTLPRAEIAFLLLLYLGIGASLLMAHRRAGDSAFVRRMQAPAWRSSALLLLAVGLSFVRQRCVMDDAAPFTAAAVDRDTSWLLPSEVIHGFRAWCMACVDSHRPTEEVRGFVQGCLLGDRSGTTTRMLRNFNCSGMGHLLAVSGLHLGLITLFLSWMLRPLRLLRGLWLQRVGVPILMWSYVLLIGSPPSAVRAAVMLTMFQAAWLMHRSTYSAHNLPLAALLLLLYDPRLLYNLSFQLSFTAAASIVYLAPRLRTGPRALRMLNFTLLLQAAMLPLMLYYFHRVTIVGCLQAFLVIPLLGLYMSLILLCLLCHALGGWMLGALFTGAADLCWMGVDACSRWMLGVAEWCRMADLRLFGDVTWEVSLPFTLGCYALAIVLLILHRQQQAATRP